VIIIPHPFLKPPRSCRVAAGGEFAFVAFGVAVSLKVLPASTTSILYLVVALSMALIPYLAAFGGQLGLMLEKSDTKALQPKEEETKVGHREAESKMGARLGV
jgi:predicted Kef-type K+ transport protein